MKIIVGILTAILTALVVSITVGFAAGFEAFVLRDLWSWFIVPLWPMLWELTLPEALGISLVASHLTHQTFQGAKRWKGDGNQKEFWLWWFEACVAVPGVAWVSGYIIHRIWGA